MLTFVVGAHPEVFQQVKAKDDEDVHQLLVDKAGSVVDSQVLAMDVLYPKTIIKPKKPGPKMSQEDKALSHNMCAMMIGNTGLPVNVVNDVVFQRWVHSINPEVLRTSICLKYIYMVTLYCQH